MSSSSNVLTDNSTLSRIDQKLYKLESTLSLISGIAVLTLIFLAVISVGGRNFFNTPLNGYIDWIEVIMPLIAFMGIAYTQRGGGHIRMDILVGALKGRVLYATEFFTTLLILILMILLVWGSWAHFQRSFDFSAPLWSRDSSIDISLPLWPAKILVPLAFSVLCTRLILQLCAYARAFVRRDNSPIAVPLVIDAATQASREAEHVLDTQEKQR